MSGWRSMKNAPRDGTPVLLCADGGEVFIGHWGHAGRFTSSVKAWIGHEYGYHEDRDLAGWRHVPSPPKRLPR